MNKCSELSYIMRVIKPYFEIETPIDGEHATTILKHLEKCARTCYKSEHKITDASAPDFVRRMVRVKKHESTIEHASATVRFICDRGVSHELVRHRLAAFSQESTRYCNYCKEQFGDDLTFILPLWYNDMFYASEDRWLLLGPTPNCDFDAKLLARRNAWWRACSVAEREYKVMIDNGAPAQEARDVLPNSLKTEVVMTCNMREWRHVFSMRTSSQAHPQMSQLMRPLLAEFKKHLEPLFGDIEWDESPAA